MPDETWYQQSLTPPAVYEINVRIGVIPASNHMQALVEIKDPTTGILLGQRSRPHAELAQAEAVIDWAVRETLRLFDDNVEPF